MRIGDTIICEWAKDGGPESKVDGFWFFRSKKLGTVALLKFNDGSREAYHSHAFYAMSWLLKGILKEEEPEQDKVTYYYASELPIFTKRSVYHKVTSFGTSYVLTFRGPWAKTWRDNDLTLTHNRKVVS